MTETLHEPPPYPPPPQSAPPLLRDPDDRVVAGVCAALGRTTGTDPVLWRVTVAVLAVFGGAGAVLYLLAWLLVPLRGETRSVAERTLRRSDGSVAVAGVVLAVVVAVVLLGALDDGPGAAALLVVAGVAWLVARERRGAGPAAAPLHGPERPPAAWAPPVQAAPRERSALGAATVSLAALVVGVLLLLREYGADGLTAPRVVAAALLVVGAGLVVGTWYGRARWLLAVGALLALLLAASAAAEGAGVRGGVGERAWRPSGGSASYSLAAGSAVLDLRGLPPGSPGTVRARVGVGELLVLVPERLSVRVDVEVGLGEVSGPDGRLALDDDGTDLREEFVVGSSSDVLVDLDLEVGAGEVEVRRVA